MADPVTVTLHDVMFDDGGGATGSLSFNTYGFADSGLVTTTPGTTLPGQTFAVPNALEPDYVPDPSGNTWVILFNGAYDKTLWLEVVTSPANQITAFDPILAGCETNTFQSFCTTADSNTRMILVGGDFSPGLALAVPEPAPIGALAFGMLGLAIVRTRFRSGGWKGATAAA